MASLLDTVSQQITPFLQARRWLIAYSGGVDSHVLLHSVQHFLQQQNIQTPELLAVHINHQLQDEAAQWQQHCQQQAERINVPIHTESVSVQCGPRESLEDKARQARYAVFESLIEPGDVLLMGHHLDDQVETLMMRMLRGSGSRGTGGMPKQRVIADGQLLRPLLDVSRLDIEAYAKQQGLSWIEDPSNQSDDYDRNFLRLKLLPLMAERWPEYRQTLARAAALNEESALLNDELAEIDFNRLQLSDDFTSIPLAGFRELSHPRQKNLLRYCLRQRNLAMPSVQQLQAVLASVVNAQQDAEPLVEWQGVQVRRFKDQLYLMSPLPKLSESDLAKSYRWPLEDSPLDIPGVGQLMVQLSDGRGINAERLKGHNLEVQFRRGGERCQPAGRSGSQTLKKLFQEYAVEPWLRDRVPLLYCGDELVAVADLWVCEHWQAAESATGLKISWQKVK